MPEFSLVATDNVIGDISALYSNKSIDDARLIAGMSHLAEKHGVSVYRDLFFLITGKNLGTTESTVIWKQILHHRSIIIAPEFQDIGLRPAMFDYLHRVIGDELPRRSQRAFQ